MGDVGKIDLIPSHFLLKSIVLYGASDTGKSMIIRNILYVIKDYFDQCVCFCGNDDNITFYEQHIPFAFIHREITNEILEELWARQSVLHKCAEIANNLKTLESLFNRLSVSDRKILTTIAYAKKMIRDNSDTHEMSDTDAKEATKRRENFEGFLRALYKKSIIKNLSWFKSLRDLSDSEKYSINYITTNPNLLIIIDDLQEDVKKLCKSSKVFNDMFTQGRHVSITFFLAIQDDIPLSTTNKKNAMVSVFTGQQVASSYFERVSNYFSKAIKVRARSAIHSVFETGIEHQKLIYSRKQDKFYKFIAKNPGPFTIGNRGLQSFNEKIKSEGAIIDKNNPYHDLFNPT